MPHYDFITTNSTRPFHCSKLSNEKVVNILESLFVKYEKSISQLLKEYGEHEVSGGQ
jgi:hypothetical protein